MTAADYDFRRLSLIGAARTALERLSDEDRARIVRDYCPDCGSPQNDYVPCCQEPREED